MAIVVLPVLRDLDVSRAYVENVVRDPKNPVIKNKRADGPNRLVRSARANKIPIRKQPVRLARRVPNGNRLSRYLAAARAME